VKQGETVFTSDELATETDARNFVLAQQFARSFLDDKPSPRGSAFQRDLVARTGPFAKPANVNASTRASQNIIPFVVAPAPVFPASYQPSGNVSNLARKEVQRLELDGLSLTSAGAIGLGVVGLAALLIMYRKR
jgi:hypothetical protein